MSNIKKKEEKEPNLGMALIATILFLTIELFCLIDYVKQVISNITPFGFIMTVFLGGCVIAMLWLIGFIIKQMNGKK